MTKHNDACVCVECQRTKLEGYPAMAAENARLKDERTSRKWYETHDNLTGLAQWLNSECCYFSDASAVIYYMEKPWKWTREFHLWQLYVKSLSAQARGQAIDTPEFTQRCIEAVDDEKVTAESLLAELEEEAPPEHPQSCRCHQCMQDRFPTNEFGTLPPDQIQVGP
jgi:hypothetical protein